MELRPKSSSETQELRTKSVTNFQELRTKSSTESQCRKIFSESQELWSKIAPPRLLRYKSSSESQTLTVIFSHFSEALPG